MVRTVGPVQVVEPRDQSNPLPPVIAAAATGSGAPVSSPLPTVIQSQTPQPANTPMVPSDFLSTVEAWLGGATTLLGFSIPNGFLAAGVVLGAVFMFGGSGKNRGRF